MAVKRALCELQEEDPPGMSHPNASDSILSTGGEYLESQPLPHATQCRGPTLSRSQLVAVTSAALSENQPRQVVKKIADSRRRELVESSTAGCSKSGHTSDHDVHIQTERERRKKMNDLFSTLHSLLPNPSAKADKSTIVDEAINYIQVLRQELDKRRFEALTGRLRVRNSPITTTHDKNTFSPCDPPLPPPSVPVLLVGAESNPASSSCLLEDTRCLPTNISGPGSLSSVLSPPSFQTLSSPNVVLNVCGHDAFISICSSRQPYLLSQILYVMEKHKLFVMNAHINSTHSSSLYMIHAQPVDENCHDLGEEYLKTTLEDLSDCLPPLPSI